MCNAPALRGYCFSSVAAVGITLPVISKMVRLTVVLVRMMTCLVNWPGRPEVVGDGYSGSVSWLDGRLGIVDRRAAAASLCLDNDQGLVARVYRTHLASDLAVLLQEHAEVMVAFQPGRLWLGGGTEGHHN